MKVLISETSPRRAEWLHVFGPGAIEVEPAGIGKYSITLAALHILNRRRLISHVAKRRHVNLAIAEALIA